VVREGVGQGFSSFDLLKGDGKGRGLIVFYKFIIGGFRVCLIYLILAKIN